MECSFGLKIFWFGDQPFESFFALFAEGRAAQ